MSVQGGLWRVRSLNGIMLSTNKNSQIETYESFTLAVLCDK